jgi:hypothetical protein
VKCDLELSCDAFVAPSLEEEIFDDESVFDFVHDWVLTSLDDGMEEFATI